MEVNCAEALRLLGFDPHSQESLPPADVLRRAFRQQALLWHPDKHVHADDSSCQVVSPEIGPHTPTLSPTVASPHTAGVAASSTVCRADELHLDQTHADVNLHQTEPKPHLTQAQAADHFKRLVNAYQVLLQTAASAAASASAGGDAGSKAGEPMDNPHTAATGEEQLLDELSAEMLLLEANKMRLSDFDMIFLHLRANGGPSAVSSSVWPEAAQSINDVWRRIRRRVERRQRRRQAAAAIGNGAPGAYGVNGRVFEPSICAKWTLLSEFLADVVGVHRGPLPARVFQAGADNCGIATGAHNPASGLANRGEASPNLQRKEQRSSGVLEADNIVMRASGVEEVVADAGSITAILVPETIAAVAVDGTTDRQRGRLPPGFYWRWLKRLVAARLIFYVFFKS